MFYSHELLGRKTPLGAIWTLAHGRKLSKGKIISINVREICEEIMQPGVPHSLRLQGILVGGVVMVFSKQQTYLLEDLQEMMRRVQAAASDAAGARGTTKTEKGKGRGKGGKNADGNNQARLEAITLMDMEDLMAPAAFGDDDILGLLAGGSLSDALASQGALPIDRRRRDGAELAGDLFEMPSLGGGATSEGGDTDAQGRPVNSRGTRTASGRQQQDQEEEVYGGAGLMHQDWLNVEDEVFADPEALDFDLLGGLDLPQPLAGSSDKSRDQSTSQQHKQAASGDTTEPQSASAAAVAAAAAAAAGMDGVTGGVPYEFDDQMFMMEDQTQEVQHRTEEEEEQDRESDQQQGRDQAGPDQGADQVRRAKQRKRKAGNVVMDDLDNLLIKNKVYREWCTNSSPLVNNQLNSGHPRQAHTSAATPLMMQDTFAGFGALPFAGFAGAAGGGVPLCAELLALFRAPEEAAAAERNTGAGKGRPEQPGSPEVNNSTGEGSLPGMLPYAHKLPLDLHQVHDGDMMMMEDDPHAHDDLNMMMAESPPHPHLEDQDMMMVNDEAHDMLGDLPFNGDIEVERMRAAATPGSSDGSLQNLLPGGGSTAGRKIGSNLSSEGGSGLAAARAGLARELGGTGTKRRLGSADLGDADNLDIFFGTGNLADLLPDVEAEQYYDDMQQQHEEEGPASEDLDNAAGPAAAGRSGSLAGSDRSLTPYNSSQYPLLEGTEPDQHTQLPRDKSALSGKTQLALSIFQQRLQRSAEQQAAAVDGVHDAAGAAAEPSVSFFGLIKEGRLLRNQAATLFYQVCVTSTAGFVSASQERPYGDIQIKQGSREM